MSPESELAAHYHHRWEAMLAQLRAEPRVTIVEAALGPPLATSALETYAADLDLPLTVYLRALFTFAGSVRLDWRLGELRGGSINIPGLAVSFDNQRWPCGPTAFDGPLRAYGLDVPRARGYVAPLDFFLWADDSLDTAAIFRNGEAIDVLVTEDYGACQTDTHLLSLGEYVDFLFRSFGAAKGRRALNAGRANPPRARDAYPQLLTKPYPLADLVSLLAAEPNTSRLRDFFR